MPEFRKPLAVLLALAALGLGVAACGDDDESSSSADTTAAETAQTAVDTAPAAKDGAGKKDGKAEPKVVEEDASPDPASSGDRYDPGAASKKVHGDGSIEKFGDSASDEDAQAAVAAAVGYYDARAADDWARACGLMASSIKDQLEQTFGQNPKIKAKGCPAILAALAGGLPRELRVKQAKSIKFTGFRVEDDGGFAIFVSDTIPNGFMPMAREDGQWKVAAIAGSSL